MVFCFYPPCSFPATEAGRNPSLGCCETLFAVRSCRNAACDVFLEAQAVLVCKQCFVLPVQHEWCLSICWHVGLHHDEHRGALHGLGCGVGPHGQIHCHLCVLVEPQGTAAPLFPTPACSSSGIGKGYWLGRENEHLSLFEWLNLHHSFKQLFLSTPVLSWSLFWLSCCTALPGGQCILVMDLPRPSASEKQQRQVLSAALETTTSYPAQRGSDKGRVFQGLCADMDLVYKTCLVYSLFLRMRFVTQLPFALNVWINTLLCGTSLLRMSADINCIISSK